MDEPIGCLEITSSGVKFLVGYMFNNNVYVLHALESTRAKSVKGLIEDRDEMVIAIKELISSASSTLKLQIKKVVFCVPSVGLQIYQEQGETNTTESNVSLFDANNCVTIIKKKIDKIKDDNSCVIDVVPFGYILSDEKTYNRLPLNKVSNQLLMQADVEVMDSIWIETMKSIIKEAGLEVLKIVNGANASLQYIKKYNNTFNEYIFIDVGSRTTTIAASYAGRLISSDVLYYGSDNITDHIAEKYHINFNKANEYKEVYGLSKNPAFIFKTENGFTLNELSDTIKESLANITSFIDKFVSTVNQSTKNLFILSGGGSNLLGFDSYLNSKYLNKILIFTPTNYGARSNSYENLISSLNYFNDYEVKSSVYRPNDLTLTRVGGLSNPIIEKDEIDDADNQDDEIL